jgi:NAD(P)-dependent dehydrogenase (short-subunit alcohol dehydrogenase family)
VESCKVVLISGASQGIGAGLVQGYRRLGYAVVANSRIIAASDDPDVVTVASDISEPAVAEAVVGAALESLGRVDSLVNNAGIFLSKPFLDYTLEDFNTALRVNLVGFLHLTQKAVTQMSAAETHETYAASHPIGRVGTIDDVVHGVLYLVQAPFVTGEFLHVDGGQSAGR